MYFDANFFRYFKDMPLPVIGEKLVKASAWTALGVIAASSVLFVGSAVKQDAPEKEPSTDAASAHPAFYPQTESFQEEDNSVESSTAGNVEFAAKLAIGGIIVGGLVFKRRRDTVDKPGNGIPYEEMLPEWEKVDDDFWDLIEAQNLH
jgi:hypothetical protein